MAGGEEKERRGTIRDFFVNHVKTIVTIIMIFGTLICIILIVMVHKWTFEGEQNDKVEACLDVAVIGAGISGTYSAWRLRHDDLRIHIFEASDRVGGRFYTTALPDLPDLPIELGALYYSPQRHRLLNRTIHALGLRPKEYHPRSRDPPIYFLRNRHLQAGELNTDKIPYKLDYSEKYLFPEELKRMAILKRVSNASDLENNPLNVKTKDGVNLYKLGLWNVLGQVTSKEGLNFIYDTAPWRTPATNGNAAVLASLYTDLEAEKRMVVSEGMSIVPEALLNQFLNASKHHYVHYGHRLACITHNFYGLYTLTFIKTETKNGVTKDIQESEHICAKKIILATPKESIQNLQWKWFKKHDDFDRHLDTVDTIPSLAIYFAYNRTWWRGHRPQTKEFVTDLPIRNVKYIGSQRDKGSRNQHKHLFMVAKVDASDVEYFESLVDAIEYDGTIQTSCNISLQLIHDINRQIAKVSGIQPESIPMPCSVMIHDWSKTPSGAGWHLWKKGVNWKEIEQKMLKPLKGEDIHVVGSTYCGGKCQLWAEGGLHTVERMLENYFFS